MEKSINKTEKILTDLEKNKVRTINTQKDILALKKINENLEEVKKDFQMKEKLSKMSSFSVILNS